MANRYLLPIYKMLFNQPFSYSDFEQRMEMQKGVYLLQNMGVPVGDYGFRWYLHGPYSQSLQDDMFYEDGKPTANLSLSIENANSITRLHDVINSTKRGEYSLSAWAECLASLLYLRNNIMSSSASEEDVVNELEKRKTYLNRRDINLSAYRELEGLFPAYGRN